MLSKTLNTIVINNDYYDMVRSLVNDYQSVINKLWYSYSPEGATTVWCIDVHFVLKSGTAGTVRCVKTINVMELFEKLVV